MSQDCTNGGCGCTPNHCIRCTVNTCNHHCQDTQYCGLTSIEVGADGIGTNCRNFEKE